MKYFNLHKLVRPNVAKLKPYVSARDEFDAKEADMVFLDANENPFENGINRYPDPQQQDVKLALAHIRNISPNHILLGNGSDEVLDLFIRSFCEPKKDNLITLPPTYSMYKTLAEINAVENREVLLTKDFQPDVNAILNTADEQSKLLFLCSPNNPTGNTFSKERIKTLLNCFAGLVVIDEAYIDFSPRESMLTLLSDYPNLVVIQTFSKAYGMAGIRLGVCYSSPGIISVLNKIKPPYNVNALTQQKALERISTNSVKREIKLILAEKGFLIRVLRKIDFVKKVYLSDANFVLIKVDDAGLRYRQLLEAGIVVRNRSLQPLCKNTLRVTVGTYRENHQLIRVLGEL